jgi:hypothetical protein
MLNALQIILLLVLRVKVGLMNMPDIQIVLAQNVHMTQTAAIAAPPVVLKIVSITVTEALPVWPDVLLTVLLLPAATIHKHVIMVFVAQNVNLIMTARQMKSLV